jgi:hypothetical protein
METLALMMTGGFDRSQRSSLSERFDLNCFDLSLVFEISVFLSSRLIIDGSENCQLSDSVERSRTMRDMSVFVELVSQTGNCSPGTYVTFAPVVTFEFDPSQGSSLSGVPDCDRLELRSVIEDSVLLLATELIPSLGEDSLEFVMFLSVNSNQALEQSLRLLITQLFDPSQRDSLSNRHDSNQIDLSRGH